MPKRRSTIPIPHADDLPTIAFTDEKWQAIERAYVRKRVRIGQEAQALFSIAATSRAGHRLPRASGPIHLDAPQQLGATSRFHILGRAPARFERRVISLV